MEVVFPAPFGPINPYNSPALTEKESFLSAWKLPNCLFTDSKRITSDIFLCYHVAKCIAPVCIAPVYFELVDIL